MSFAIRDVARSAYVLSRQIGGVRTLRDAPGTGRDPLVPVPQPDDPAVNDAYRAQLGHWLPPLPGESLLPVLQSPEIRPQRRSALVETDDELNPHFDLLQMRVLVTNDYKLCHYSPTGEVVLFDRRNDPGERTNLASRPDMQPVVAALLAQLLAEVNRTEPRRPRRFSDA